MSKLITASVNLQKIDKDKLIKGEKGTYLNLTVWVNDEDDQFGNNVSVQQSLSKDEREAGAAKIYLGNGKAYDDKPQAAKSSAGADSDLPF